jgi:flagellar basal body-associated protein FliL
VAFCYTDLEAAAFSCFRPRIIIIIIIAIIIIIVIVSVIAGYHDLIIQA